MSDTASDTRRAQRLRELFAFAVETAPDERDRWLAAQTHDDASLLEELRELLAANDHASGLFPSSDTFSLALPGARSVPNGPGRQIGSRVGHYRLDARLGEGGMGEVFKAWDLALDRPAAVKLIRAGAADARAARLLREIEVSAHLQHPAIATFFEGGTDGGTAYLAMELVDGTTLRERLTHGPLSPGDALTITTGLLEALAHAHAAGLLHRDIKPENVMLTAAGLPKLLDFGIAGHWSAIERGQVRAEPKAREVERLRPTAGTVTAAAAGTPGYMSPEQLRGDILTPASDVFQVGALLFEMLTGRRAFGAGSTMGKIAATLAGPPDLTPIVKLQPPGLSAMVARALALDPTERFNSAAAFLRQMDALVDRRLRSALPESLIVADFASSADSLPGQAEDWIGRGLADALSAELLLIAEVKVVGRPRVAEAEAAAKARHEDPDPVRLALMLGVRWVVTGHYRRDGDVLHVTVRFVDASTGVEAAVSASAGTADELLGSPRQLTRAVIDGLALRCDARPRAAPARQARAIELHLVARELWQRGTRDAHPRVFALLDDALGSAPDFVPALALLAAARSTAFIASREPTDLARAIEAADRAIAIDPHCTEAWSWRGYALLRLHRMDEALAAYERATQLAGDDPTPSYLYGSTLLTHGRPDAALPHLQRAVTLEPRYGIAWLSLGWTLHSLHREDAACYALGRAQALEGQPGPTFVAGVGGYLAECLRDLGELDRAREEALRGLESIERSDHSYRDTIRAFCLCALARTALAQGDAEAARAAFAQAVAQMRGRTLTLAGGHVLVQALAGLARATADRTPFDEALALYDAKEGYSFNVFFGCSDDTTAFELAASADALGLHDTASQLLARAHAAGSRRAL